MRIGRLAEERSYYILENLISRSQTGRYDTWVRHSESRCETTTLDLVSYGLSEIDHLDSAIEDTDWIVKVS